MALDSVNRSNPSLPAVKKPETPPPPPPAPVAAKADPVATAEPTLKGGSEFETSPLRRSTPGTDSFDGAAAQPVVDKAGVTPEAEAPSLLSEIGSKVGGFLGGLVDGAKQLLSPDSAPVRAPGADPAKPPKPSEDQANQDVTAEMSPREKAAYDKLNEEQRTGFNELNRAAQEAGGDAVENTNQLLTEHKVDEYLDTAGKADPAHQETLQKLLFNGTLNAQKDANGNSVLDALSGFARGPGATCQPSGADRSQVIGQILDDVNDPTVASNQPDGDTHCGLLTIQGDVARTNPAAYAALMTELADKGSVTVENAKGESVTLEYKGPPDPNSKLSTTQQLFCGTLENYADKVSGGFLGAITGFIDRLDGLNAQEVSDLKEHVYESLDVPANFEPMTVPDAKEAEEAAREALGPDAKPEDVAAKAAEIRNKAIAEAKETIDEQLKAGKDVQVEVNGPPSHWVTVTDHVSINIPPFMSVDMYKIDDGNGPPRYVTAKELEQEMGGMVYDPTVSDVPAGSYNSKWDDGGIGHNSGGGGGDPPDGG